MRSVDLIAITQYLGGDGSPESLIEHAGRVCTRTTSRDGLNTERFIKERVDAGHESIIEHVSATFEISDISRACSHQLVRHRLASYSQESQRYVDMSALGMVVPPSIGSNPKAMKEWEDFTRSSSVTYAKLRDLGVRKEDARFILPNAAKTHIIVTMNFRELLHFFRLRISPEAQWEIRAVALSMLGLLVPHAPAVFEGIYELLRKRHPDFFTHA